MSRSFLMAGLTIMLAWHAVIESAAPQGKEPVTVEATFCRAAIEGNLLFATYLKYEVGGVLIFDLSEPDRPRQICQFAPYPRDWISAMAFQEGRAFFAGANSGIALYDISDPTSPTLTRQFEGTKHPVDMIAAGEWLYIAEVPCPQ